MSTVIGNCAAFPMKAARKEKRVLTARLVLTAAGAVDTTNTYVSDSGIVFTHGTAGIYTFTYPACPGDCVITTQLYSPTPTVFFSIVTAKSPTAGTATVKTYNAAGTITDPASGDEVHITIVAEVAR